MTLAELRLLRRRLTAVADDPDLDWSTNKAAAARAELSLARGQVRDAIVRAEAEADRLAAVIPSRGGRHAWRDPRHG